MKFRISLRCVCSQQVFHWIPGHFISHLPTHSHTNAPSLPFSRLSYSQYGCRMNHFVGNSSCKHYLSPTPRDECQFKHKHGFLLQKIPIICYFKNQLKLQHCSDAENICQSSVEIAYLYFPVYSLKIMFATLIWWNYSFQSPAGLTSFSNRKLCVNE